MGLSFFKYKVGEKVQVVYNPYEPKEAEIKKFFPMWFPTLFMLIFSGILFAVYKQQSEEDDDLCLF